jgi:hypothetical protein
VNAEEKRSCPLACEYVGVESLRIRKNFMRKILMMGKILTDRENSHRPNMG